MPGKPGTIADRFWSKVRKGDHARMFNLQAPYVFKIVKHTAWRHVDG